MCKEFATHNTGTGDFLCTCTQVQRQQQIYSPICVSPLSQEREASGSMDRLAQRKGMALADLTKGCHLANMGEDKNWMLK